MHTARYSFYSGLAALAATVLAFPAWADETVTIDNVEVTASKIDFTGIGDSASEGAVTGEQLKARPLLRPAEVRRLLHPLEPRTVRVGARFSF